MNMMANREAFGRALAELGDVNDRVVVLDADLAAATYTKFFKEAHPERFIDCGIAECNMMSVAAGLSTTGLIPFVSTFAVFATLRASEQFRNSVCYPHLNVKVAATHGGIECGADGATHQAIEDIAVMRAMPGNTVLVPADPVATRKLIFKAAEFEGPCYIRMGRDKMPALYDDNESFEVGGSKCLKEGKSLAILAIGSRVHAALKAAEKLQKSGISAAVYDMYSVKPLDLKAVKEAAKTGHIVTCEDHLKIGGLGSAVCEAVCELGLKTSVSVLGVDDSFGRSGAAADLYPIYGIDEDSIVQAAKKQLHI